MKSKISKALLAGFAIALGLSAFTTFAANAESFFLRNTGTGITKEEAEQKALGIVGSGSVISSKAEYKKDGRIEYEIIIVNGDIVYDIEIFGNGAVKEMEQKKIAHTKPGTGGNTTIDSAKAMEIALGQSKGGTVIKCELEREKNGLIYEVEIINNGIEHEVELSAETGEILHYSYEYDD